MVNEYGEMWVSDDHEEKFMKEIENIHVGLIWFFLIIY